MKTCLTSSGSDEHHPGAFVGDLDREHVAEAGPARSSIHCAWRDQIAVCIARGIRGPGGRPRTGGVSESVTSMTVASTTL